MILECAGWSQRNKAEPECTDKSLAFIEYHNESARYAQWKAMAQEVSVAVRFEQHVSFAGHCTLKAGNLGI